MNQINSIILEGNIVKDAILTEPADNFKVCRLTIGVNRWFKNAANEDVTEVSYFDIEAYSKMAEYCAIKGKKGRGIRVVGRLKQNTWKDDNGKFHSKVYVVAEHIEYRPMLKPIEEDSEKTKNTDSSLEAAGVQQIYKQTQNAEAVAF